MREPMDVTPAAFRKRTIPLAIFVGGFVAGTLDATSAFISYGWGMPKGIASGILGASAFQGGAAVWILGLALHYVIAFSAAAIYCAASRRLEFLKTHFLVSGAFYGIAVWLVMNLVILPLSAFPLPVGPFTVAGMLGGLSMHMILIGLPISVSLRLICR
jgi:uncharacterized membrane protein YagU involved in acid resistance